MDKRYLIEINNLTKLYGNHLALSDVTLSIEPGKIIGILGPNGSGKTTLIKILNGLLKDFSGEVLIDHHNIGTYTKSLVSYLPDESYFSDWMKAKDALNIFNDMYPDFDILNNIVYSANKSNVVLTMVDGNVLYKNGEFTTIDVERMGYEVSRLVREVVNEVNAQ